MGVTNLSKDNLEILSQLYDSLMEVSIEEKELASKIVEQFNNYDKVEEQLCDLDKQYEEFKKNNSDNITLTGAKDAGDIVRKIIQKKDELSELTYQDGILLPEYLTITDERLKIQKEIDELEKIQVVENNKYNQGIVVSSLKMIVHIINPNASEFVKESISENSKISVSNYNIVTDIARTYSSYEENSEFDLNNHEKLIALYNQRNIVKEDDEVFVNKLPEFLKNDNLKKDINLNQIQKNNKTKDMLLNSAEPNIDISNDKNEQKKEFNLETIIEPLNSETNNSINSEINNKIEDMLLNSVEPNIDISNDKNEQKKESNLETIIEPLNSETNNSINREINNKIEDMLLNSAEPNIDISNNKNEQKKESNLETIIEPLNSETNNSINSEINNKIEDMLLNSAEPNIDISNNKNEQKKESNLETVIESLNSETNNSINREINNKIEDILLNSAEPNIDISNNKNEQKKESNLETNNISHDDYIVYINVPAKPIKIASSSKQKQDTILDVWSNNKIKKTVLKLNNNKNDNIVPINALFSVSNEQLQKSDVKNNNIESFFSSAA